MTLRFRLLTEPDVRAVLTMDDLIETMASALERFSSAQVVQPVHSRSIGRWRHYEDQLRPALTHLQPWIDRWGYATPQNSR